MTSGRSPPAVSICKIHQPAPTFGCPETVQSSSMGASGLSLIEEGCYSIGRYFDGLRFVIEVDVAKLIERQLFMLIRQLLDECR